jgi:Caspase domain
MMVKLARQGGLLGWGAIVCGVLLIPGISASGYFQENLDRKALAQALPPTKPRPKPIPQILPIPRPILPESPPPVVISPPPVVTPPPPVVTPPVIKDRRTALVIGNALYSVGKLNNPINDATDLKLVLERLGFEVRLVLNANRKVMNSEIDNFSQVLKKGGLGLFFYAGHGLQVNGENYLVPINAEINRETDVEYEAIPLGKIMGAMEGARNPVNLMMIDACRDNPYGRGWRSNARGLASVFENPEGMLISFSTSPGKVASDGTDRNSPYMASLLGHIQTPNIKIEDVFKNVRQDVTSQTNSRQRPWELSSINGTVILKKSDISIFNWEVGVSGNKRSGDVGNGLLIIEAAPKTDVLNNSEPRVLRKLLGDYEAIVKVEFSSDIKYQRATLGIRDSTNRDIIARLYLLEGKKVEAAFYPENRVNTPSNAKSYPGNTVYLKIIKQKKRISTFYSLDKSVWLPVAENSMARELSTTEVFMSVLSTDSVRGASAKFSEWSIKPL